MSASQRTEVLAGTRRGGFLPDGGTSLFKRPPRRPRSSYVGVAHQTRGRRGMVVERRSETTLPAWLRPRRAVPSALW
jgi:hypothetical protein